MSYILHLSILVLLYISSGTGFPNVDDDTVVIRGTTPAQRPPRPTAITTPTVEREPGPPPVVLYNSNGKLQCITREGLQGQCSPFKECYPILFVGDDPGKPGRNVVLRDDVLNSTTSCFSGTNESPIPPSISDGLEENYEEIVCCTDALPTGLKDEEATDEASTADPSETEEELWPPIASSCTKPNIVNSAPGSEANALPHAYPWMAVLVNRKKQQFCGGSLIDNYHVLTAAHCITQYTRPKQIRENLFVHLGAHNLREDEPTRVVAKVLLIMKHGRYNSRTFEHDIAIIRLTEPVNITKFVQPICLDPKSDEDSLVNMTLAGWGKTCETCELSPTLRQATVMLMKNADCQKKYRSHPLFFAIPDIKSGMVCALTPGMDACQGDSGGPLFFNDPQTGPTQIGIVSWGAGCAAWPGVYTRVSSYTGWISKNRNRKITP